MNKLHSFLFLSIICFLVYANSLNNVFISDDLPAIVNNPNITKPDWKNPSSVLNSLAYSLGGLNPFIHHFINIALHCLAVGLVFYFLKGFFTIQASLIGASLFAVHPIHTEAVSWVSGRPYIFLALFTLVIYFLCQRDRKHYLLALLFFIYYCLSSIYQALLIGTFLVLTSAITKKIKFIKSIPIFIISIITIFITKREIQSRVSYVAKEIGEIKWTNPVYNMAYSIFEHLKLMIYPARLTLYHEPAIITSRALTIELIILGLIALFLPFLFRKVRILFYALSIFVLFLGVTYSPVMIAWLVAERYIYFNLISLCIIFAFSYEYLTKCKKIASL